jgi:hypothetical protein
VGEETAMRKVTWMKEGLLNGGTTMAKNKKNKWNK